MSVGQADAALVVLVALRIQADIVEVGGTVVGDLIAEAAVEAFGLVAGACLSFPFGLAITQTSAEVAQLHADGGSQFVATLQVVDLAAVERLIADTDGEAAPLTDTADGIHVVQLVQIVAGTGHSTVGHGSGGSFTGAIGCLQLEAAQAGGGVDEQVVGLVDDAGQTIAAVVPALTGHVTQRNDVRHGGVLTAQLDGTEAAIKADPGFALPEAVGVGQATGIGASTILQVEDGLQAIAEVFGADDADTGTTPDAVIDLQVALAGAVGVLVQALDGNVDATGELDAGLGLSKGRHGSRNGQCYERFFHG